MDSENIKQHFRPEEAPLIDQVNDWVATATGQYRPVLTAFLNPRQRYIAQTIANRVDEIKLASDGGWSGAEMQRLLFYPTYYQPTAADFDLQLLTVDVNVPLQGHLVPLQGQPVLVQQHHPGAAVDAH